MFYHGADWFVNNQDSGGGWPSNVVFNKDRKKYPGAEELQAGWYGAMCQGQAISVLVRAFTESGDDKYLEAAENAVKVFSIPSSRGGVKAVFLDKYPWYEEYPTNPTQLNHPPPTPIQPVLSFALPPTKTPNHSGVFAFFLHFFTFKDFQHHPKISDLPENQG